MDDFSKELAVSEAPTKAVVIDLSIDFVVSPATAPYLFLNDVNFYICWVIGSENPEWCLESFGRGEYTSAYVPPPCQPRFPFWKGLNECDYGHLEL